MSIHPRQALLLASVIGVVLPVTLSQPAQARVTNVNCTLVPGLTLPPIGQIVPSSQQVASPCTNRKFLILSDATKDNPIFFTNGSPKKFNCVFLAGTFAQTGTNIQPITSNDGGTYAQMLNALASGSLPALDAQCDITVGVAYRSTGLAPFITAQQFAQAALEANQDIYNKLNGHMDDKTIIIGHSQGAYQGCQLILGNNLSKKKLPAFKLIGLSFLDLKTIGGQAAILDPFGITQANLCPQTGVKSVTGKTIPVVYQDNANDELFGTTPYRKNATGIAAKNAFQTLYGQPSLVSFVTTADNPNTPQVEGLGLPLTTYQAAFTQLLTDTNECPTAPTVAQQAITDSYHAYTLYCGQSPLIRSLRYFDYFAQTPSPTLHDNSYNWKFALVDGPNCVAPQYTTLSQSRVISKATQHPNGNVYVAWGNSALADNIAEPSEVPPFCHLSRFNPSQNPPTDICVSLSDLGTGGKAWSPMIGKDGTIYIADLDTVYAFNPDDTKKWTRPYLGSSRTGDFTADGNLIIATQGVYSAQNSLIYIIDPATGNDLVKTGSQGGVSLQSLIGTTLVTTTSNTPGLDPTTGSIIVTADLAPDPVTGLKSGKVVSLKYTPPTQAGQLGSLSLNWTFPIPGLSLTSPTVAADGTIFITDGVDTTYALNRNGTVKWSYNIGANSGASHSYNPITGNLFILAGTIQDNNQRVTPFTEIALDKNGKLLWDTTQPGKALSATSIPELSQNGYLYNVMGDDSSGTLVMSYGIIDQQTGAIVSTAPFDSLSGAFSALDNQGNIYVTSYYPQPQYATGAGQIVLLPGAVVGTVKLAPQAPSVCGLTTGPNKSVH